MEYTVFINNRNYELPKKTLDVVSRLDEVLKIDSVNGLSVRQKYEKLYEFMIFLVGREKVMEMFGSEDLDEVDLSELTIAVQKVADTYDKYVMEYGLEKSMKTLDKIPFQKLTTLTNTVQSMGKVGMMSKV